MTYYDLPGHPDHALFIYSTLNICYEYMAALLLSAPIMCSNHSHTISCMYHASLASFLVMPRPSHDFNVNVGYEATVDRPSLMYTLAG